MYYVIILILYVGTQSQSSFAAPIGVVGPVLTPRQQIYLHSTGYAGVGKGTTMGDIYNGVPPGFRWM